jgi:hypothetical protein
MKLHWVHTDCLRAEGPAVFVFDDRQLARERWSLQRIGFVYECLLEMPEVEIFRGPMAETLARLAAERQAEAVVAVRPMDPWLQGEGRVLEAGGVRVEWVAAEPFVTLSGKVDLGRFSRYWRRAERELFR